MRTILRALRWLTFAAFLVGVGWIIYQILPAGPRWVVEGKFELNVLLPDSSGVVLVEKENAQSNVTVRDIASGAVRSSVHIRGELHFTGDRKRLLWLHEDGQLAGLDLQTGKEWRQPLAKERELHIVSDNGDVAVLCADESVYTIDIHDGAILDRTEWGIANLIPEVRFTPHFVILAGRDRDPQIWDRRKRMATTLPIQCDSAKISPAGNSALVEHREDRPGGRYGPCTLVDFPQVTRPVELGTGTFRILARWEIPGALVSGTDARRRLLFHRYLECLCPTPCNNAQRQVRRCLHQSLFFRRQPAALRHGGR